MKLLPMDQLGPHEQPGNVVRFGFLLPWVSAAHGNALSVKVIHEDDQFLQAIPPLQFPLQHSMHPEYGDMWSGNIAIDAADAPHPDARWGQPGRYVYRFVLESPLLSAPLDWIVDPYAREFGIGRLSAFTLGYTEPPWGAIEDTWKTPPIRDLVAYEIMLHEFANDLEGATARLPYLRDLGINCLEIMPVANVDRTVDWGFEPIGPFGLDERFGKRRDMRAFIQAAHEHGIAVMLDMIYGHTGRDFAYERVYSELGYHENPFMGAFAADMFGPSVDYGRAFARDFYFTANWYWIDRYHADGIRYDCVPNYYDGFMGKGYAQLVYATYEAVKATGGAGHWQRFFHSGGIHLIQCAEQLEGPIEIVSKTYSNATWQNETLSSANSVAYGNFGDLYQLGLRLGLEHYPESITRNGETIETTALQYLENHDHPRFICRFGTYSLYKEVLREGNRDNWYRLQPYTIGLLTCKGVPMLWEGQEIVENYDVPDSGPARIGTLRLVRWEKFYDHAGQGMIRLMRRLVAIRRERAVFRRGSYYFFNDWANYQSRGLLVFTRWTDAEQAVVALNFSGSDQSFSFAFPRPGSYVEQLHGADNHQIANGGETRALFVPSNYGRIWLAA